MGHSIYKGKAALTVEPRAPEFVSLDVSLSLYPQRSKSLSLLVVVLIVICFCLLILQSGAFKLSKDGFLLLQFAPAAGVRQYDWSKKQVWFHPFLTSDDPFSCII